MTGASVPEALVSVVMPVYNAEATLGESMTSVLAQSHRMLELLIADDGSSDGSAEIAEAFQASDGRVRVIRLHRGGVVKARNTATEQARGDYIAFCDSDDLWHPDKLNQQLEFMKSRGSVISATGFQRIDESGAAISGAVSLPSEIRHAELLATNYVCCATVMYKVSQVGKLYMYDYRIQGHLPWYMRLGPRKPLHEDYIAWARLLAGGGAIQCLNRPLTSYRVRANSHSANKIAAAISRWYINRNVLGVPMLRNLVLMAQYATIAVWRRAGWVVGHGRSAAKR